MDTTVTRWVVARTAVEAADQWHTGFCTRPVAQKWLAQSRAWDPPGYAKSRVFKCAMKVCVEPEIAEKG